MALSTWTKSGFDAARGQVIQTAFSERLRLIDPPNGEDKAQSCDIAWYQELETTNATPQFLTMEISNQHAALIRAHERQCQVRNCQINTDIASQARLAPGSTIHDEWLGSSRHISKAKTNSPPLPIAEPAASIPAASFPCRVPRNLLRSFFCFSCFSIRVALAGKIAGKARNSPPMTGPNRLAIRPAKAVISPPKRNRMPYSYHLVCPMTEGSTLICMTISTRHTTVRMPAQTTEELSRS